MINEKKIDVLRPLTDTVTSDKTISPAMSQRKTGAGAEIEVLD